MLVLPNRSARVWDRFLSENKVLVYKYIVRKLYRALSLKNKKIHLFKFDDDSMKAWVYRDKIPQTLNEALKIFIDAEEYEYAQKTKKIMMKYEINKLIEESTKLED